MHFSLFPHGENSLAKQRNIVIDTDSLGVHFGYYEAESLLDTIDISISDVSVGVTIVADFSDSIKADPIPLLDIDLPLGDGIKWDFEDVQMERINAVRYFHYLPLPNNEVDDTIRVYVNALDKAGNPIINTSVFDSAALRLDNVNPTIDILYPVTNSYVSSSSFSFQISEGIKTGSVSWLGTSGGDNGNSYEISIDSLELA